MVAIAEGDVWWADLPDPSGSDPGFRRPVVVVQSNAFNRSRLATTIVVPLTSNLRWAEAPGNLLLRSGPTGLPKDSVANVSQVLTVDRALLAERTGRLSRRQLEALLSGVSLAIGMSQRSSRSS